MNRIKYTTGKIAKWECECGKTNETSEYPVWLEVSCKCGRRYVLDNKTA